MLSWIPCSKIFEEEENKGDERRDLLSQDFVGVRADGILSLGLDHIRYRLQFYKSERYSGESEHAEKGMFGTPFAWQFAFLANSAGAVLNVASLLCSFADLVGLNFKGQEFVCAAAGIVGILNDIHPGWDMLANGSEDVNDTLKGRR